MQHQHHHRDFNRILTGRYRHLDRVARGAGWFYQRLGCCAGTEFNLAFVSASETIAFAAARWAEAHHQSLFAGANPDVASMFIWHLAEEVEHKSVAFDVHRVVKTRRRYYPLAALLALMSLIIFVSLGTTTMLMAERRLWNPLAWFRLTGWAVTFAFELIPLLVLAGFPHFHPDQLSDPLRYQLWLRQYDTAEVGIDQPHPTDL